MIQMYPDIFRASFAFDLLVLLRDFHAGLCRGMDILLAGTHPVLVRREQQIRRNIAARLVALQSVLKSLRTMKWLSAWKLTSCA